MSEPESNWAWLGLLKWSLSYVDGTVPSEESEGYRQVSDEDRAFLEEVMKNGIIDEGERMKTILSELVAYLESIRKDSATGTGDNVSDILQELQDIVEQIDYAKSFAAMGGIPFLLGCASERKGVPRSVRSSCLAVLATLCQNNPAVQLTMLEQGNIPKLTDIYFAEFPASGDDDDVTDEEQESRSIIRGRAIQTMSCCVRNHEMAENIFCLNSEGKRAIESGLGLHQGQETAPPPNLSLRRRTLFFLQALLTSDSANYDRVHLFAPCIRYVAMHFIDPNKESNSELREMTLSMLNRILTQKKCVNPILDLKTSLVDTGIRQVSFLRGLDGEEKEYAAEELNLWESFIVELARAQRDVHVEPTLITSRPADDSGESSPQ